MVEKVFSLHFLSSIQACSRTPSLTFTGGPQEKTTGCSGKCMGRPELVLALPCTRCIPWTDILDPLDLWHPGVQKVDLGWQWLRRGGRPPAPSGSGICVQLVIRVCLPNVFTGAVNFLRSLLEPDPVKRPNIQQALANRWLNENYTGKVPCTVTHPNR